MGIKFKAKTSVGDIAPGDIPERELFFDFNRNVQYTSTNGTDVVKLVPDDLIGGGMKWDPTIEYQSGTLVTVENTLPGDIVTNQEYVSITNNNIGNDPTTSPTEWRLYNAVKYINTDVTISIGTGGDYPDLDTALNAISRYVAVDGAAVYMKLLAGHVVDYPVYIRNVNLPNVYVTADDSTINISCPVLTKSFKDYPGPDSCVFNLENVTGLTFFKDTTVDYVNSAGCHTESCIFGIRGGFISIPSGMHFIFNGQHNTGFYIINGGSLNFDSAIQINGTHTQFRVFNGSSFLSQSLQSYDFADGCLIGMSGAIIGMTDAYIRGLSSATFGVSLQQGSTGNLERANCDFTDGGGTSSDIHVSNGSIANARNTTGGTSITPNTITSDGIIFR